MGARMAKIEDDIDSNIVTVNKIDTSAMIKAYFVNGLSESDIARMQGISRQAVNQALKPYKSLIADPVKLRAYKDNRSLIFDGLESELVSLCLVKDKHKKATLGNVAYALDKVYNINRLEKNQSTQNININSMVSHVNNEIERATEQLKALEQSINTNEINELQDDLS